MNMDLYGLFEWGDEEGVKQFALAHRFAHEYESQALAAQYGATVGTYAIGGEEVVEPWIALMRGEVEQMPREMYDWLEAHNANHQNMLALLGGASGAPTVINVLGTASSTDLSMVDFSNPAEMYQWLTLHQELHSFEQQTLGLT